MAISPGMRMIMLASEKDRNPRSDYSDNGDRRMIGFDRYPDTRTDPNMRYTGRQDQMYAGTPHMPPIYPMTARDGNSYGDIYAHGSIYAPGAMNKPERDMHSRDRDYDHDASDHMHEPITEHKARKWVEKMTTGEKYKPEITEQMRASFCPDCDKWEFYVAMNAMYADYRKTAQEMGMDKADFYARHARDFIQDDDAAPGKVARYMETIPKK